jgi:hypothetical protein
MADHGYYFEEGHLIYSPDRPLKWEKASFKKTFLKTIIPLPNQSLPFANIPSDIEFCRSAKPTTTLVHDVSVPFSGENSACTETHEVLNTAKFPAFGYITRSPDRAEELYIGSKPEVIEPEVPKLSEGGNLVWLASSLKDRKAPFLDFFIKSATSVYPRVCERALHYGESVEWIRYCFCVLRYWMFLCNKRGLGQFSGIDEIVQDIVQ